LALPFSFSEGAKLFRNGRRLCAWRDGRILVPLDFS
jgi:hypothetical protein